MMVLKKGGRRDHQLEEGRKEMGATIPDRQVDWA